MLGVSSWEQASFSLHQCLVQDVKAGLDLNDAARGVVRETKFHTIEEGAFWAWSQIPQAVVVGTSEMEGWARAGGEGGDGRAVMHIRGSKGQPSKTRLTLQDVSVSRHTHFAPLFCLGISQTTPRGNFVFCVQTPDPKNTRDADCGGHVVGGWPPRDC